MLNELNNNFYSLLFNKNEIIKQRDVIEKNISEQLLTIRTLVIWDPSKNETEELAQLAKILAACKLQPTDYMLLNGPLAWKNYRDYKNIQEVLLFGLEPSSLGLPITMEFNKLTGFDERLWIKTASVSQLLQSKELKNELWQNALKPHYVQ